MNSEQCVDYILSKDRNERNKAFAFLYSSCFPKVKSLVLQNKGTRDEAEDLFQDTVAILYQNILHKKFDNRSTISTYAFGIAKNLWLMELRKRKIQISTLIVDKQEEEIETEVNVSLLHRVLDHLDGNCRKLLISFYFHQNSMKDLTAQFGLSSEQVARTKKLRCMKKLRDIVKRYHLDQNQFKL